ncbi:type II toxin-antitoxin system VapC family toxin [Candidatus Bathyarchaeota archaeon]|nr:type II toxin-antitoxin system VapC family toxin [Candidatus Bathyarchaeota archaeon]MBS7628712.1 type II toxin-antitoxin system VapC family toxin [Candidatus Bathyarchaeota archaeon]
MVCLDTSFLIELIRRNPEAERKLKEYISAGAKISTTPITACELFKGAYRTGRGENIVKVRKILSLLEVLDFSIGACEMYGKIVNELSLKGSPIGDLDTMIASIALINGESLLTLNKEHFEKVHGLTVEPWLTSRS